MPTTIQPNALNDSANGVQTPQVLPLRRGITPVAPDATSILPPS